MGINCIWNASKLNFILLAGSISDDPSNESNRPPQLAPFAVLCCRPLCRVVFCVCLIRFSNHFKYWTMEIMSLKVSVLCRNQYN